MRQSGKAMGGSADIQDELVYTDTVDRCGSRELRHGQASLSHRFIRMSDRAMLPQHRGIQYRSRPDDDWHRPLQCLWRLDRIHVE